MDLPADAHLCPVCGGQKVIDRVTCAFCWDQVPLELQIPVYTAGKRFKKAIQGSNSVGIRLAKAAFDRARDEAIAAARK